LVSPLPDSKVEISSSTGPIIMVESRLELSTYFQVEELYWIILDLLTVSLQPIL